MKTNIGAMAKPLEYKGKYRKDYTWYPKRFKPDYGLDEWLCGTPYLPLPEQLRLKGGLFKWERGRVFKSKRTHASFLLS